MIFGSNFMGFHGESMENMIGTSELIFRRVFLRRVFSSELFFVDLGRLARFLDEPLMDLDSLGDFEWNGMVEIIG